MIFISVYQNIAGFLIIILIRSLYTNENMHERIINTEYFDKRTL